jgi:hypothetical protein
VFTWAGLLLLGWVVFELTSQPALGALLVCLKFGWGEWRTALWLRRYDPHHARGRACFWIYLAWALWKITAAAFVVSFLFSFLTATWAAMAGPAGQANVVKRLLPVFVGTVVLFLTGGAACLAATLRALWLARRYRLRLWVGAEARLACKERVWPPRGNGENRLRWLLITVTVLLFFSLTLPVAILLSPHPGSSTAVVIYCGCCLVVAAFGKWTFNLALAQTPSDCWPEETLEQAAAAAEQAPTP